MFSISISFNPKTDDHAELSALISRIYGQGAAVGNVTIHPDDRPDAGEEPGAAVEAGQLDASGICWDARIHSNPPKINQTGGMYRRRKGIDDLTVASVTKELQAKLAGGIPTPPPVAAAPALPAPPAVPTPPVPALPTPPAVPTPPVPPSAYASFVDWIAGHVQANTAGCTQEWVCQALASMGVADGLIANLATAPADKIAEYRASIASVLGVPAI